VLSQVIESGMEPEELIRALEVRGLLGQTLEVLPWLAEDSVTVAQLYSVAKAAGLSLGDRACLALGFRLALPVLTTDREWQKLPVNIEVRVVC
jgi:PIN domain nuclease of toxin-antitoxin system